MRGEDRSAGGSVRVSRSKSFGKNDHMINSQWVEVFGTVCMLEALCSFLPFFFSAWSVSPNRLISLILLLPHWTLTTFPCGPSSLISPNLSFFSLSSSSSPPPPPPPPPPPSSLSNYQPKVKSSRHEAGFVNGEPNTGRKDGCRWDGPLPRTTRHTREYIHIYTH